MPHTEKNNIKEERNYTAFLEEVPSTLGNTTPDLKSYSQNKMREIYELKRKH